MRVAEPTVERLIQYYRLLIQMRDEGRKVVSSLQIGEMLGIKASQVRKDLSYFGEIGKRAGTRDCGASTRHGDGANPVYLDHHRRRRKRRRARALAGRSIDHAREQLFFRDLAGGSGFDLV